MKTKLKYLSHSIGKTLPVYGNRKVSIGLISDKALKKGDSCNTFKFLMGNHWGTHIDSAAHFFKNARKISEYSPEELMFSHPCIVNVPLRKGRTITLDEIKDFVTPQNDIILIKTGFTRYRGKEIYSCNGPAVSPEIAGWVRTKRPRVRAIGIDFVSIGSYSDREVARKTHRAFLDPDENGLPLLLIEDMDLSVSLATLRKIWVAPLLIEQVDSSPCTVLGVFNNKSK